MNLSPSTRPHALGLALLDFEEKIMVSLYNYGMSNGTLIVNGVHQCDRRFSDVSRGRQCAFKSLSALLCAN